MLRESPFPYSLLALAISLLASLHVSVNHGARDLPHLLGFFGAVILISFTTPAPTASYNNRFSTAVARSSFPMDVFSTKVWNFAKKSALLVLAVHVCADLA